MKTLGKILFGTFITVMMTSLHAATINLSPSSVFAPQGSNTVVFDVLADFGSNSVLGGGIDFTWNSSVLTYGSFVFNGTLGAQILSRDTDLDVITLQSTNLLTVGFGNFGGLTLTGPAIIGTLKFNAVGAIGSSTTIGLADSVSSGAFFNTSSAQIPVVYTSSTATVVPVPAAIWFLLSGLGGLGFFARRNKASS